VKTFQDMGIPFPLFEACIDEACEYRGSGRCSICEVPSEHIFELGIGCALIVDCSQCGAANGLDAHDRMAATCRVCEFSISFPADRRNDVVTCYTCLRVGRAAITKDTPFGMVSWEQIYTGITHGTPGLITTDFETVELEDDWVGARLPLAMMNELLRTPTFPTIQGEVWEFCCQQPMVYVGSWEREEFNMRSPDGNGKAYFESIVQDSDEGLWEDEMGDITGVYVFRCQHCNRFLANWDMA
jgi:uncharacterized protein CbrC (UPF0167 family)